jgi:hypothetical protein
MTLPAPQATIFPPKQLRVIESGVGAQPTVAVVANPVTPSGQVTQLPAVINITCYAGDDLSFSLPMTNSDGTDTDLTSAVILAQVRQRPETPAIVATFSSAVTGNVITLTLAGTDSQGLSGVYVWDCQVTNAGAVYTPAAGAITVNPDVSHP